MALVEVSLQPGPDDAPAEVRAQVGDDLVVRLPDQSGSTGYQWTVVDVPDVLTPDGDGLVPADGGPTPGAAGAHLFSFRAVGAGTGTLSLALARAWEAEPARRVAVLVVVE
jgi:predicted secreted protein